MPSFSRKVLRSTEHILAVAARGERLGLYETRDAKTVLEAIRAALKPKRSVKPARRRKAQKDEGELSEWRAIKEKVLERAGGVCECCASLCPIEVDHFIGGSGQRKTLQSIYTCWALCSVCHHEKTNNRPGAAWWAQHFAVHCDEAARDAAHNGMEATEDGYMLAKEFALKRIAKAEYRAKTGAAP